MTSVAVSLRSPSQRVCPMHRARMLRLELRHSTMIWLLPLLGALFYFDAFRTAAAYPPFWFVRSSVILDHLVPEFSLFAAGVAAWTGSREGRRRTVDLVGIAARPRWASTLASFAATTTWTLAAYLGCVAVLYGFTATQPAGVARLGGRWRLERLSCAPSVALGLLPASGCRDGSLLRWLRSWHSWCSCGVPGRAERVAPHLRASLADELGAARGRRGVLRLLSRPLHRPDHVLRRDRPQRSSADSDLQPHRTAGWYGALRPW